MPRKPRKNIRDKKKKSETFFRAVSIPQIP